MPMTPEQLTAMKSSMLYARLLWLSFCFVTPLALLLAFSTIVLQGHPSAFLAGFAGVPWKDPIVFGLLLVAVACLIGAGLLPERITGAERFRKASLFSRLLVRHLFTCAFLETIAICGFALGALRPSETASLALALMAAPMLVGCIIFPNENDWRFRFQLENERS